jgi:hypothetical protein
MPKADIHADRISLFSVATEFLLKPRAINRLGQGRFLVVTIRRAQHRGN